MTKKVLVIGAHGKTGQRVVRLLKEGSHEPLAMIRDVSQKAFFDEIAVPTVLADLEYPIDHAVRGCDAVIFAAGSGSKTGKDKTVLIDYLGAIRSMVAAAMNGAKRYIMLSAVHSDPESTSSIQHYHRAKGKADAFLRSMSEVMEETLDWTIVCPGRLTDEPGDGKVFISPGTDGEGDTSRDNLATTLVACLDAPNTIGKTFVLLDGDEVLADAIGSV